MFADIANVLLFHGKRVIQEKDLENSPARTMYKADGVGLAAPQVTYIMQEIKKHGLAVNEDVITIQEAQSEILRVLGR